MKLRKCCIGKVTNMDVEAWCHKTPGIAEYKCVHETIFDVVVRGSFMVIRDAMRRRDRRCGRRSKNPGVEKSWRSKNPGGQKILMVL